MFKINQKNIFGINQVTVAKHLYSFVTKERVQGFFVGIVVGIFTGVASGFIVEYIKTLLAWK